jgi:peptidoglycan L-alanyl-D-glutamate endopeptidase CwlK
MDKLTIERIQLAHPKIRQQLLEQYKEINNQLPVDVRLRFAYVYRTPEEQRKLFQQRPKVTRADAWQSIHNYGIAFDIVLLYDKDRNGTFETASWEQNKYWMQVVKYFVGKDWEWGGSWKSFKDAPHFQMTFGHTWQSLRFKIQNDDIIIDNGITYPKI